MGKPSAPEPVDPYEAAQAQTGANVSTSLANTAMGMVDQSTPYGDLTYDQTGTYSFTDPNSGVTYDLPTWAATTTLNPTAQLAFDEQQRANASLSTLAADQAQFLQGYMAESPDLVTDYSGDYAAEVQAAMMERLQPQMAQQYDDLSSRLVAQGLQPGSEAFDRQMDAYYQGTNDMQTQAYLASQGAARDQAAFYNEATLAGRNQPINEITALLSGSQVNVPQFGVASPAGLPTTDISGMMYDSYGQEMDAYKAQMAQANAMWGGLFGLAGDVVTGMPFS